MVEYCSGCEARMPDDIWKFRPDWSGFCAECEREMMESKGPLDKARAIIASPTAERRHALGGFQRPKSYKVVRK